MIFAPLAIAAAVALGSAPADAGSAFRVTIPVGDLDLTSPAGRRALLKRSRAAARRTCSPDHYPVVYDPKSLAQCRSAFDAAADAALARSGGIGAGAGRP